RPLNPSILQIDSGYLCIYRTVNYIHNCQQGSYRSQDADGIIRTKNFLVKFTNTWEATSCHEIVNLFTYKQYSKKVLGLEDCRMFSHDSRVWFTCTTLDTS